MTTGILHHDQNLEKQMGCMAGFLQLFDRHQILTGKRLYTTKRLPPSLPADSTSQSEKSIGSPAFSGELIQQHQRNLPANSPAMHSPAPPEMVSPAEVQAKTPVPLPVFEFKEGVRSMWKLREAPRLSLDSRAIMDGKGSLYPREIRTNATFLCGNRSANCAAAANEDDNEKQRRSPSVIARLMGLEALPDSGREPMKKAELRRSASESRVSRDLRQIIDETSYHTYLQSNSSCEGKMSNNNGFRDNVVGEDYSRLRTRTPDMMTEYCVRKQSSEKVWRSRQQQQRKSYFDVQDVFPERKNTGSLYGEIEKRLKMRGIDEPAKDLETLKQILEALQLKGLLHSKKPTMMAEQKTSRRNIVFDHHRQAEEEETPIVIMKPSRTSTVSINRIETSRRDSSPGNLRSKPASIPPVRPRIDRRAQNSINRSTSNERSPSSVGRRRALLNNETQRRGGNGNDCAVDQRMRSSPTQSPKMGNSRKLGSDQPTNGSSPRPKRAISTAEISPKERILTAAEDESATSTTISESSRSTNSSQIDAEGSLRVEYYKEGQSLLERCDKLLHSIAEITTTNTIDLQQPSPVSVLDPSFYKDESSPSPVMKRSIHFKDYQSVDLVEESWSAAISPIRFKFADESNNGDCDFLYISEILQANSIVSEELDVFSLLEKQQYKHSSSKASRLHRKLVFDTVSEILDRIKQLPPWKAFSSVNCSMGKPLFRQVWSEFRRIREKDEDAEEDLFQAVCGVLRKDMTGDKAAGWGDWPAEMSEAVLDIERLIFKDVVAETIRDLAEITGKCKASLAPPRRKLVF